MANSPATTVTITAVDQVTRTLDKMTARIKAFSAPYEKMQKSFGALTDATGLNRVGAAFEKMGRSARDAATSIARIIEPLGIVAGAASVAGVVRMTEAWADWGSKLGFSARMAGTTANGLYQLQNAGRLAGLSAGQVTTAMDSLKKAMTDAPAGRNTMAAGFFNQMHLSAQQLKGDATTILPQVADMIGKLMKVNPQLALHPIQALFGGDADLLKLFGDGSAGLQDFIKQAKSLGGVTDDQIKKADELRRSQAALGIATKRLGNSISATLQPVIQPVIDYMTAWIVANQKFIEQRITDELREFSKWLKSPDFEKLKRHLLEGYNALKWVVRELGGVQAAITDLAILMAASFALKVITPFWELGSAIGLATFKLAAFALKMRGVQAAAKARAMADIFGFGEGATVAGAGTAAGGIGVAGTIGAVIASGALIALMGYLLPHVTQWLNGNGCDGDQNSAHGNSMAGRGHAAGSGTNAKMRFNAALAQDDVSDFMRMGWTRPQANIIEGNLRQESGLNEGDRNRTSGAYGLAQWLGSRASDFQRVEGVPLVNSTRAQQRAFINWELHNSEKGSGDLLHALTNEGQAAQFGRSYERYGPGEEGERVGYAQQLAAPMQLAAAAPAPGAVGGGDAKMHIVVEAANGAKASVKSASNNVVTRMAPGVAQTAMGGEAAF